MLASTLINMVALTALLVTAQVSAFRQSSARLMADLQKELQRYRIVLLEPKIPGQMPSPTGRPAKGVRKAHPEVKPLAIPNPRLLRRLDSRIQDFVADNRAIEDIITREIVRDIDRRILDVGELLKKSSVQISFEIDAEGRLGRARVERSSKVPSIDHLALELVKLLEKYQILQVLVGVSRVVASIRIEDKIDVSLEGEVADPEAMEGVRRQVQNALTLMRFSLPKEDAAMVLQDVAPIVSGSRIFLSKTFEKDRLVEYLMRYYQPESPK